MTQEISAMGALSRGLLAGAVGSWAMSRFFEATERWRPEVSWLSFVPPEPEQRDEQPAETVARRLHEGLMRREKLQAEDKRVAARRIHLAYGAAWGGLYGLARASSPEAAQPAGALGFGAIVWLASEVLLLPAFNLAPRAREVPMSHHAYGTAAHLSYGLCTALAYRFLSLPGALPIAFLGAAMGAARSLPERRSSSLGAERHAPGTRPSTPFEYEPPSGEPWPELPPTR